MVSREKRRQQNDETRGNGEEIRKMEDKRCFNENHQSYPHYGGRGITVCEEWRDNFQAFYDWAMANGYSDNLTIDRKDNDGNYEPSNCRWATNKEQANNKRNNRIITFEGETHDVTKWSEIKGIPRATIYTRLCRGWDIEKVLTTPGVGKEEKK